MVELSHVAGPIEIAWPLTLIVGFELTAVTLERGYAPLDSPDDPATPKMASFPDLQTYALTTRHRRTARGDPVIVAPSAVLSRRSASVPPGWRVRKSLRRTSELPNVRDSA